MVEPTEITLDLVSKLMGLLQGGHPLIPEPYKAIMDQIPSHVFSKLQKMKESMYGDRFLKLLELVCGLARDGLLDSKTLVGDSCDGGQVWWPHYSLFCYSIVSNEDSDEVWELDGGYVINHVVNRQVVDDHGPFLKLEDALCCLKSLSSPLSLMTTRSPAVAARLSLFPITAVVPDTPLADDKNVAVANIIAVLTSTAKTLVALIEQVPTHETGRLISGLDSMRQASIAFQESVVLVAPPPLIRPTPAEKKD